MRTVAVPIHRQWSCGPVFFGNHDRRFDGPVWLDGRWLLGAAVEIDPDSFLPTTWYVAFAPGEDAVRVEPDLSLANVPNPAQTPNYSVAPIPILSFPPPPIRTFSQMEKLDHFLMAAYGVSHDRVGLTIVHRNSRRHCVIVPQPHANYRYATVIGDELTVCAVGGGPNPPVVTFDNPLV